MGSEEMMSRSYEHLIKITSQSSHNLSFYFHSKQYGKGKKLTSIFFLFLSQDEQNILSGLNMSYFICTIVKSSPQTQLPILFTLGFVLLFAFDFFFFLHVCLGKSVFNFSWICLVVIVSALWFHILPNLYCGTLCWLLLLLTSLRSFGEKLLLNKTTTFTQENAF